MNAPDHSLYDLIERLLARGLRGTHADVSRAAEISLAVMRYGFDCLSDQDRRWLNNDQ